MSIIKNNIREKLKNILNDFYLDIKDDTGIPIEQLISDYCDRIEDDFVLLDKISLTEKDYE
jgi:hypothetical protein